MNYRIATDIKDIHDSPLYWIERKVGEDWQHVFGTMSATAGEAWELLQTVEANERARVAPEERAMLLSFTPENHGGCFPHDADGSYWLTGSDLA